MDNKQIITIETAVNADAAKVWDYYTQPDHITKWNFASDDWHCPKAENDLHPGGKFNFRMEAKDGSFGFDFGGVYDIIQKNRSIEYTIEDGRKIFVNFDEEDNSTFIKIFFEAENLWRQSLEIENHHGYCHCHKIISLKQILIFFCALNA